MIRFSESGAYRLMDGGDLFDMTSRGWRLVAVLDHQAIEHHEEPMPLEAQDLDQLKQQRQSYCGHCSSYSTEAIRKWKKPHVVATQCYLLHKAENELVEDLHRDISALKNERDELTAVAREQLGVAQKELTQAQAVLATQSASAVRETEMRRKLEGDIAKLRHAIGDLRMKEILEGKA